MKQIDFITNMTQKVLEGLAVNFHFLILKNSYSSLIRMNEMNQCAIHGICEREEESQRAIALHPK